tara:strand:+ start:22 stop:795 length:774 start_codon:yes stop_codon:yes gene_type:complete
MSSVKGDGGLGNAITRNLSGSILAKKHNLKITYHNEIDMIKDIGIPLFSGKQVFDKKIPVTENNYFNVLNENDIDFNIEIEGNFMQSKSITDEIFKHLNDNENMEQIKNNNPHKDRYNNNNDCFIHIRLGDTERWNPGFKYYDYVLSKLIYDKIYLATNDNNHNIIKEIQNKYKNVIVMDNNLVDIIQFGSTCRYVILSYGTFSAITGYISFYSQIYCLKMCENIAWDWGKNCDMFQDKSSKLGKWVEIDINNDLDN